MSQLSQFLTDYGGSVLFLAILAEQIGLPIPAAPLLVAAGALAADGGLSPATAIGIAILACVLGDVTWFYAGRQRGSGMLQFVRKILRCDSRCLERAERLFAKFGISAVIGAKFIPGIGFLIPALAGAFRTHFSRFLWFDLLGSVLYGTSYLTLGLLFSNEVNGALESISKFALGAVGVVLFISLTFFAGKYLRQRRTGDGSRAASDALITVSEA
jgi:membrane protein DedA with SNARE-associated domain